MTRYRDFQIIEVLKDSKPGQPVRLAGWVHRVRNHGGVLFVDLRDDTGLIQCVFPTDTPAIGADALRSEWVVSFTGIVRDRPEGTQNEKIPTGEIELVVTAIEVLGRAIELPMPVFGDLDYPEEIRLKFRYLDLRRTRLHENIRRRNEIVRWLREEMWGRGFEEFQTPILTASSPEGARDFLVPSRLHPGEYYALPQAPQQFKQLLLMAGFDCYFQIAPCFRDEAARADRSPGEFYQLDIEMSFVTQEDVFALVEPLLRDLFGHFDEQHRPVSYPFPRIPYAQAMLRYGTDKPDLRNPLIITDVTEVLALDDMTLAPFKGKTGRVVRVDAAALKDKSRKWYKAMEAWAVSEGASGLGYVTIQENAFEGPLAKFFGPDSFEALWTALSADARDLGDVAFFAVGEEAATVRFAGLLRTKLAEELGLIDTSRWAFCWITDFPMFEWNEDEKRIDFSHNPFSMPNFDHDAFLALDPADADTILNIKAFQYDIVCNGIELSSGAIRNHRPDVMEKAFGIAGYGPDVLEAKFGGMLNALRMGAPPHGGIAPGIDRIVMLLCGAENLREVVAFPLNQQGRDLLMGAPAPATAAQLKELHLRPRSAP